MSKELVSIISPVYNGEKYIANFLDSVLEQTYSNIELIIVDDGSTDYTYKVVERYKGKFDNRQYKLIYKKQRENRGQAAAINVGLSIFTGRFMMWMDSDDILYPKAIEEKVNFLKNHSDIDFVLNKGEIVDSSNVNKALGILERKHSEKDDDKLFEDLISEYNVIFCPGTIMVRRDSLIKAIPGLHIYESREGQNWQLMLPLAYTCKYGYIDEVLFKYVVHNDSHSHMKRDYDKEINRRDNFYTLQVETINNIVEMSDDEKKYWMNFADSRRYYTKYLFANQYHKYQDSKCFKKEIGDQVKIDFKNRFIIMDIYCFLRKLKRSILRIIKHIFK